MVTVATNITTRMVLKKRYLGKNVDDHEEARIFLEFSDMIPNTFGEFYLADFIPSVHPITSLFNGEKKIASVGMRADAFVTSAIPLCVVFNGAHQYWFHYENFLLMLVYLPI